MQSVSLGNVYSVNEGIGLYSKKGVTASVYRNYGGVILTAGGSFGELRSQHC